MILLWSSSIAATASFTCRLQISQISYWMGTNINQPMRDDSDIAAVLFHCCYRLLYMLVADPTDLLLNRNKYLSTNWITDNHAVVNFHCCYRLLYMPIADLTDLLLDRNKYLSTNRITGNLAVVVFHCCYRLLYMSVADLTDLLLDIYQPTGITGDLAAVVFQCCYHLLHMPVADLTDLLLDRNKYLSTNRNYW